MSLNDNYKRNVSTSYVLTMVMTV